MVLNIRCRECKTVHSIQVDDAAYKKWQYGAFVQDAFPDMPADQREMLISNTCGKCFDKLFSEDVQ